MRCDRRHVLAVLIALAGAAGALACGGAYRPREWAEVVDEEALIVWNPATKTEHFVRRAAFKTKAKDFGFLVPTPTKPTLGEVDDALFGRLTAAVKPPERDEWSVMLWPATCAPLLMASSRGASMGSVRQSVRVLEAKHVAGYDAVVLEADDAGALAKWLTDHGYETRASLATWLEKYVAEHWKITAFKLSGPGPDPASARGDTTMAPKSVRLSFTTEKPFFPYREPADQRERPGFRRSLRLFFVGPEKMEGTLDLPTPGDWHSRFFFADKLPDLAQVLGDSVPAADVAAGAWLGSYLDEQNPRPGVAELVFAPAKRPYPIRPPPIVHERVVWIPLDIVLLLFLLVRWIRNRKKK